jgi:hypothetical protein
MSSPNSKQSLSPHTNASKSSNFLKRVNLSCNFFGDEGFFEFLDAIQNDIGVNMLDFQFNKITQKGALRAKSLMYEIPYFPALDLRNNPDIGTQLPVSAVLSSQAIRFFI